MKAGFMGEEGFRSCLGRWGMTRPLEEPLTLTDAIFQRSYPFILILLSVENQMLCASHKKLGSLASPYHPALGILVIPKPLSRFSMFCKQPCRFYALPYIT